MARRRASCARRTSISGVGGPARRFSALSLAASARAKSISVSVSAPEVNTVTRLSFTSKKPPHTATACSTPSTITEWSDIQCDNQGCVIRQYTDLAVHGAGNDDFRLHAAGAAFGGQDIQCQQLGHHTIPLSACVPFPPLHRWFRP